MHASNTGIARSAQCTQRVQYAQPASITSCTSCAQMTLLPAERACLPHPLVPPACLRRHAQHAVGLCAWAGRRRRDYRSCDRRLPSCQFTLHHRTHITLTPRLWVLTDPTSAPLAALLCAARAASVTQNTLRRWTLLLFFVFDHCNCQGTRQLPTQAGRQRRHNALLHPASAIWRCPCLR
jgi:hypothetical protein